MKCPHGLSPESSPFTSRRRAIRLHAPPDLFVSFPDEPIRAVAVDISTGGLGLVTNVSPRHGTLYGLILRKGPFLASCDAMAVHVRRGGEGRWLVGMAFVQDERLAVIERFVDELTSDLIQFSDPEETPWPNGR
jgi:hypothetical protein